MSAYSIDEKTILDPVQLLFDRSRFPTDTNDLISSIKHLRRIILGKNFSSNPNITFETGYGIAVYGHEPTKLDDHKNRYYGSGYIGNIFSTEKFGEGIASFTHDDLIAVNNYLKGYILDYELPIISVAQAEDDFVTEVMSVLLIVCAEIKL